VAGEAEARQALSAVEPGVQATVLTTSTVRAQPRDGQRGRPGRDAHPDPVVAQIAGAVAASIPARPARVDQHRGGSLATNARDETHLPPPEGWHGDTGQVLSARGCRLLQDPPCFASSRARKQPERLRALVRVMTVCLLVDAAWEDRLRQALNHPAATVPDQQGPRSQQPTARWVLQDVVGRHVRCQAGPWPMVLNRTEAHQHWRRLLGPPDRRLYDGSYA
jgi:hypothetical protein